MKHIYKFSGYAVALKDMAPKNVNVFSHFFTKIKRLLYVGLENCQLRGRGYLGNVRGQYNNTLAGLSLSQP